MNRGIVPKSFPWHNSKEESMKGNRIILLAAVILLIAALPLAAAGKKEGPALGTEENPSGWSCVPAREM